MSTEIKTLKEEMSELKAAVTRMIYLLNNDEGTGQKGLVASVTDLKKKSLNSKMILQPS